MRNTMWNIGIFLALFGLVWDILDNGVVYGDGAAFVPTSCAFVSLGIFLGLFIDWLIDRR